MKDWELYDQADLPGYQRKEMTMRLGIPTPVMSTALMMRFASQGQQDYTARLLAMMRKGFGGHALKQRDQ
jgi:6-phosphogluconate dehydrogenase (decarboxylating)